MKNNEKELIKINLIFTTRNINFISLIISIIIFLFINFIFINLLEKNQNFDENDKVDQISKITQEKQDEQDNSKNNEKQELDLENWYIEIPSISLKAPISSGVDLNTLNKAVGHFDDTSLSYGNIGLAAHNRRI